MIAGRSPRMMRAIARHADLWNGAWYATPDDPVLVARMAELDAAARDAGRDPATIGRTVGVSVRYPDAGPAVGPRQWITGSPQQIADGLAGVRGSRLRARDRLARAHDRRVGPRAREGAAARARVTAIARGW